MSYRIYDVTLTDLGTYSVRVVAAYPDEAIRIAKTVLLEDAFQPSDDLRIVKREIDAIADEDPAGTGECQQYQVESTYSLAFEMTVPAKTQQEAVRHAKRLYHDNAGPFEFITGEDQVGPWYAREVQP